MVKIIPLAFIVLLLFSACTNNKDSNLTMSNTANPEVKAIDPSIQKIINTFFQYEQITTKNTLVFPLGFLTN